MKKSPLSTPRGNGGRPDFGLNSGGSPGRGYPNRMQRIEDYFDPNGRQETSCTRRPYNGGRGHWGRPRDHRGNHHHHQPPPIICYSALPPSFPVDRIKKLNRTQRDNHRSMEMAAYLNIKSCLEDPWAALERRLKQDLSFDNELGDVSLDDSATSTTSTKPSSREAVVDESPIESDGSFVQTNQEHADSSVCLEGSKDVILL